MGKIINVFDVAVPEGNTVSDVFQSVMVAVKKLGGQTVTRPSPNTLVIESRAAGAFSWAALSRRQALTITVEERDGRLFLSAIGEGNTHLVNALERFIADF
jgi:hypothetical protein